MGKGDHREAEKEAFLTGRKVSNVGGVGEAHTNFFFKILTFVERKKGSGKSFLV